LEKLSKRSKFIFTVMNTFYHQAKHQNYKEEGRQISNNFDQ